MTTRQHIAAALILLMVLAQGLQLLHGIGHLGAKADAHCVLCLKAETQKHGLLQSLVVFVPTLVGRVFYADSHPLYQPRVRSGFLSRAPPLPY